MQQNSSDNASTSYALNPVYADKIKQIVSTKLNRSVDDQDVLHYMRSLNNSNKSKRVSSVHPSKFKMQL